MYKYPLGKNNNGNYIDENELFILYSLMRRRYISSWDEAFIVKNSKYVNTAKIVQDVNIFEKEINEFAKSVQHESNSQTIVVYHLLELGRELDEKNFSIHCNADYSLMDGGFLYQNDKYNLMMEYLEYVLDNKRHDISKFNALTDRQKKAVEACVLEKNKHNGKIRFPSNEAYQPIKEYQDLIVEKNGEKEFVELVNKLIRDYDGGYWDKDNLIKFIEIYVRHNKKIGIFNEDAQAKLSRLIFEHANTTLRIENIKKLENDLIEYVDHFINDQLKNWSSCGLTRGFFKSSLLTPKERVLFGFEKQKEILLEHIKNEYGQYKRKDLEIGSPFFEPEYIGDKQTGVKITLSEINRDDERFLFVHTMLALAKSGYLKITDFSYGTTEMFDEYDRGFLFHITLKDKFFNEQKETIKDNLLVLQDRYEIAVKDREIWINEYLVGKPHAVGSNFEFFEYVRSKPVNTLIERDKMPKWGDGVGYASVKDEVKNKSFIKMLNELGFKGGILKAFFYKRSRDSLIYRGDEITKEDLEKAGIKKDVFLKELELAHARNSPE